MSDWVQKRKPDEARQEVARRVVAYTGDRRNAPLAAAAVALLMAQGRKDVGDRAIRQEIESLTGALRARYAFEEGEIEAAFEVWPRIRELAERTTLAHSWLEHVFERSELEPAGMVGDVLWIAGNRSGVYAITSRLGAAIEEHVGVKVRALEERVA